MDIQNFQNLENTVDLMLSDNHIDRLKAEYMQTKIRYQKLKNWNLRFAAKEIYCGEPSELQLRKYELYNRQEKIMQEYLNVLELRIALVED
jgi:hypothetical protein